MAQTVQHHENNVEFKEGPFVVCCLSGGDAYRIEAEFKGHKCPVIPDPSVCQWLDDNGFVWNTNAKSLVERFCDRLNLMVHQGQFVLKEGRWVRATLGS